MRALVKHIWRFEGALENASSEKEENEAHLRFINPVLPRLLKRTGDRDFPPLLENAQDVILIVANHLSDEDEHIIRASLDLHPAHSFPNKYTAFTYEKFQFMPTYG